MSEAKNAKRTTYTGEQRTPGERDPDIAVVTCALSGVLANRKQCPGIPYTPAEIADEAKRAYDAGASVVHIHARNDDGSPTFEPAVFAKIKEEIRARCPCSQLLDRHDPRRYEPAGDHREGEPPCDRGAQHGHDELLEVLEGEEVLRLRHDLPEHLLEDHEDAGRDERGRRQTRARVLRHRPHQRRLAAARHGPLKPPLQFSFIVGVLGGIPGTVESLQLQTQIARSMPGKPHFEWEVIGISHGHWRMMAAALALGGNVRTGLEDHLYLPNGEMARNNGDLVDVLVRMVRDVGRRPATVDEAREILGLRSDA
jgi:3-keto-5-aminohexanoate cleavage enzyme